jgi:hypothetical protein
VRRNNAAVKIIRDRPRTVDLDEFLARPLFAHLATSGTTGPCESPVWFLWEDEIVWIIGSRRHNSFPGRIEQEPRCAVGVVDFDRRRGLVHHVGMRGRATVAPFDPERAARLLARYLGPNKDTWDARFRDTLGDGNNVLIRFVAETVVARDASYTPSKSA